jgi:acetylornithine/succinyldiaminopimelate/putrescine aminotransferase
MGRVSCKFEKIDLASGPPTSRSTPGAAKTHMPDEYLGRGEDPALQVARGSGSYIFNPRGRRYIDFASGWCVGNLGWNHPVPTRAVQRFRGPDYVYPEHGYKPWTELARRIAAIVPGRLQKTFRATGGSEAIELALQAAMLHTKRSRFLSLEGAYHGNTLGALSIGASENRERYPRLLQGCLKVKLPLDDRALNTIERHLKRRDVAAFVMEPVSINLGVLVPPQSFMTSLQRLCHRYGTLLLMDEVACGFGRTGTLFASEQFRLSPDILCLGKAITGGVLGLGAMVTTRAVAASMARDGNFWSTYGWTPRSVAAALATIEYMTANRARLMAHVSTLSGYFGDRLSDMFPPQTRINIRGLAIGIDLEEEDRADDMMTTCLKRGLVVTTQEATLLLLPALTIERNVAARGLDILANCVSKLQ